MARRGVRCEEMLTCVVDVDPVQEGYVPGAKPQPRRQANKPAASTEASSGGLSPALVAVLVVLVAAGAYFVLTSM